MDKIKHYIVYKTTNLVNGKIYIGIHSTFNLSDINNKLEYNYE